MDHFVYLTVSVMLYFESAPACPSYFRNYHSCFSVIRMLSTPISTGVVNPTAVRGSFTLNITPSPSATSHCFLTCYTSRWQIPSNGAADFPAPLWGLGLRFTVTSFHWKDFLWLGPLPWGTAASQGRAFVRWVLDSSTGLETLQGN